MKLSQTILWQIHDGKPGHRNQLRGLTSALAEVMPTEVHSLRTPSRRSCLGSLWSKKFAAGVDLPTPDLILGAGHATHLAVLAARRARGGQAVVLMKPSLPPALFDLCLIPEHDEVAGSDRVVMTRGVLNVVQPTSDHDSQAGLLLIGGPSAAHDWSDERMLDQIAAIANSSPAIRWQLTNSRRTPSSFLTKLVAKRLENIQVTPHEETTPDWVPQQLARAGQVWVSKDSVSMVYESLTSGAAVGVLEVPSKRHGRVAAGMERLIQDGWATRFVDWPRGATLCLPPEQLDEARRCAQIVTQRLLRQAAA